MRVPAPAQRGHAQRAMIATARSAAPTPDPRRADVSSRRHDPAADPQPHQESYRLSAGGHPDKSRPEGVSEVADRIRHVRRARRGGRLDGGDNEDPWHPYTRGLLRSTMRSGSTQVEARVPRRLPTQPQQEVDGGQAARPARCPRAVADCAERSTGDVRGRPRLGVRNPELITQHRRAPGLEAFRRGDRWPLPAEVTIGVDRVDCSVESGLTLGVVGEAVRASRRCASMLGLPSRHPAG
jgi:hypothetical protein